MGSRVARRGHAQRRPAGSERTADLSSSGGSQEPPGTFWARFRRVDGSPDPGALADFLDAYARLEPVAEGKRRSFSLLEPHPAAQVVDVGCGTGDDVRALRELVGDDGRVVGVDSSESLLAEARRRAQAAGSDIELVQADASALPFEDDSFDAARCDRTLQHLESPATALAEMIRVVRPGGRVVITESGHSLDGHASAGDDLLRRVRERFAPIGPTDGWFGAFVPLLVGRSELVDVGTEEQRGVLNAFPAIDACFQIERAVGDLVAAGEQTAGDADAWLESLRADVDTGRVEAVIRVVHFFGRSPGAQDRSSES